MGIRGRVIFGEPDRVRWSQQNKWWTPIRKCYCTRLFYEHLYPRKLCWVAARDVFTETIFEAVAAAWSMNPKSEREQHEERRKWKQRSKGGLNAGAC